MVGVEYGNGKVKVTYSRCRNKSSSSCLILFSSKLLSTAIKLQIFM